MMNGLFKCIKKHPYDRSWFELGKTYEFKNGKTTLHRTYTTAEYKSLEDFHAWNGWSIRLEKVD